MNKVYRTVFNEKTNTWVAVAETAKAHGKSGRSGGVVAAVADGMLLNKKMLAVSAAVAAAMAAQPAMAANARIENGSAPSTIAISPSGSVVAGSGSAKATGEGSIATGMDAKADGANSIALGSEASTETNSATYYRIQNTVDKTMNNIAIGKKARSGGLQTIVMGAEAVASKTQSIALGFDAQATGDQSLALGANARSVGDSSIAIGGDDLDSVASTVYRATSPTADNDAYNDTALAKKYRELTGQNLVNFTPNNRYIGTSAGQAGVAVGVSSKAADLATAVGTKSHATGDYSAALGVGANATLANAVALGAGSTTATNATDVPSATIGAITYGGGTSPFAGSGKVVPGDQVSVGAAGFERQIKHVAPGAITAASTDAINGSQLFYVAKGLQEQISNPAFATHYYSVNGSGPTDGNYNNDGATGTHALAAGVGALAAGEHAVAVGSDTNASAKGAIAIGNTATAQGLDAMAIGKASSADAKDATAVGNTAVAKKEGATAIGTNAQAPEKYATAVGTGSKALSGASSAFGNDANAGGWAAVAVGRGSAAAGASAVAVGEDASAAGKSAVAVGAKSNASNDGATAVGHNTQATNASTALGDSSQATGLNATALGWNANAAGRADVYIGKRAGSGTNNVDNFDNVGIGESAVKDAGSATKAVTNVVGIGTGAAEGIQASHNIAIGAYANGTESGNPAVTTDNNIALGQRAYATGGTAGNAIAIGNRSKSEGSAAVAVGALANAQGAQAVAIGQNTVAQGAGSIVLGGSQSAPSAAKATGSQGIAIGQQSASTATKGIAIGVGAQANHVNGVALGSDSETAAAVPTTNATINGVTYSGFAGTAPTSTVSIGKSGGERTLTNVAAGRIADTSTDAINGSQLYSVVNGLGFDVNADNDAAKIHKLGKELAIVAGNTAEATSTSNLKTEVTQDSATGKTTVTVSMKEAPNFTSVTTTDAAGNKTVTNGSGVTITPAAGNPVSLTTGGLNNGGNKITNVAEGTDGTDAVNVDQLKAAKAAATTKVKAGNGISVNGTQNADGSTTYTVAADTTPLTVANGKVTPPAAADANKLATAGDIANAINNSGFQATAGGNLASGSNATPTTVKPGQKVTFAAGNGLTVKQDIDNASGNQTYTYALDAQSVVQDAQLPVVYTKADGSKVYKQPDGKFYDAPTGGNEVASGDVIASMQNAAGSTTAPTTLANVKSNLADAGNVVTNPAGNSRTDLAGKGNNAATVNDVLNSGFTVQGNGQNKDFVTHGDTINFANGQGTVANVTSTNGVTTVKFDTPMTYADASGNPTSTPSNKVNLVGGTAGSPVTLGNVADGTVAAGSKEAVNGSQLHATNQNVANNAANIAKGINFGGTTGSNNYQLGDTINVKGDSNITSTTVAGGAQLALNPNLNVTSVTTTDAAGNKTVTNGSGVTITPAAGNPVSLTTGGLNNGGNKITNVAAGTAGTDAVNISQLNQALGAITGANTANFTALNNKVNEVAADAKAGTAAAMAVAGLPQAYLPGKSMMAVGGSVYRGESGYAIGYSTISDGGNWIVKGTATGNSRGHYGATAAVGYQW